MPRILDGRDGSRARRQMEIGLAKFILTDDGGTAHRRYIWRLVTAERHRAALIDLALAAALVAIELSDMFAFDPGGRHDPLDVFLLVALDRIERTGRAALTELRGLLRDQPDEAPRAPQPGIALIDELARATRQAGVEVELNVETHDRAIPATIELSAYRIVQEALTNVLRHSGAHTATVTVRDHQEELTIEIIDDGQRHTPSAGDGRGISGMRERARATGGSLEAHSLKTCGFRVTARLPVPG